MYLVLVTALFVICAADKLDRTYLPPASAKTAGGSSESLRTPFRTFNQGLGGLPKGGYRNEFEGVVVDAAAPGTRASGSDGTGLGGPRIAYGSTHSKVGDAAFTADTAFPRISAHSGLNTQGATTYTNDTPGSSVPERIQAPRDRESNIVTYQNDVSHDSFNYAFETDNGIVAREDGVEANGVKSKGGYSYTGDDGQVYSVTYTADERGYQPTGDHLPTPPPIPEEILKSLEQNAKDEASGVVDDGSYDAQKYNTEEDYTKSDSANEKYNAKQVGSRPHSDTDTSSSFNNQNNQAIVRPGFSQFDAVPVRNSVTGNKRLQSTDSSKIVPSNGNNFGNINVADKISPNGQAPGFGFQSNNQYLPPNIGLNQNRRPAFSKSQSNVPSGFTHNAVSSSALNSGVNGAQNSDAAFIPLSQQKLQDDNSNNPKFNSPVFGKPTIIDSTLAIKDPFSSRPSQKPQFNRPIGGSFQVVSGNVYSSKNEYLPPGIQSNKSNQNKENQGFQVNNFGKKSVQQFTDTKPQSYGNNYSSTTTNFMPVSRPTFSFQSTQKISAQNVPQDTGNNLSTQLSQTTNSHSFIKHQSRFSSGPSNFNIAPNEPVQYRPSNFVSQFPTSQPETELTTPFESTSDRNKLSDLVSVNGGPNTPSLTGSTNSPTFNSPPSNNFPGQSSFNIYKVQEVSPTRPSASGISSVSGHLSTPGIQNVLEGGSVESNLNNEFFNKYPTDVQYASSTQRPTYSQNTQKQSSDDSYYYNKPSRLFKEPTTRRPVSSYPSSSFQQLFHMTQPPFGTKNQPSYDSQTSYVSQSKIPDSPTRYPRPPTLESVTPTVPSTQDESIGSTLQSQFNRITQASATAFLSPAPTASANFHENKYGQYSTSQSLVSNSQVFHDSESESQFNQQGPSFAQATATVEGNQRLPENTNSDSIQGTQSQFGQTQQYNGEVYEYKKPPQTVPAAESSVPSKQFGQTSQFGTALHTSQDNQPQNAENFKPGSQFGSKFTQQTVSSFGITSQGFPINQANEAFNVNEQLQNQAQSPSRPTQFGSIPSKPAQSFHISPGNQAFNPSGQIQTQFETDSRPGQYDFLSSKPGQKPESKPDHLGSRPSEISQSSQPIQGASKFPPVYDTEGSPCCKKINTHSHSSQLNQQTTDTQISGQVGTEQIINQNEQSSQGIKPVQSISSFPGVGESFGGPRKPPSFDANGYHY